MWFGGYFCRQCWQNLAGVLVAFGSLFSLDLAIQLTENEVQTKTFKIRSEKKSLLLVLQGVVLLSGGLDWV